MNSILFSGTRTFATVSSGLSRYPPRKQLTWNQCQEYIKAPVMLLVQLDNLDTPSRLALKVNLGQMGLSLKTPKAHILKKVIRQSRIRELEPSIVGFMGVATSSKEPCELQNCLQFLNSHSKVIIIGGKIGLHAFSTEGINDIISQVPSMRRLHEALVGLLQSPAQALSSMLQRAPQSLTATLTQHIEVMAGNSKEGKDDKEGEMETLLRLDDSFDVVLLDRVVTAFFQGHGPDHATAQKVITQLQEHPDAWQKVDYILENSKNMHTKILEKLIQTRWNALPREQCEGVKNYVVTLVIRTSSDETTMKQEKMLLNKLNLILVQLLKQEWPKNWPTFIGELVSSSRTSLSLCENNMTILKLLSEEVFDYSAEQMTTVKAKTLKTQLCGEFSEVFQLCTEVLEKAQKPSLIVATLEALLRFLKWIPLGYIFETALIDNLRTRFLTVPAFRNVTLQCLTEISALTIGSEYDSKFVHLFQSVMDALGVMVPYSRDLDLAKAYSHSSDEEQRLIQNLALFFSTCLGSHLKVLEAHVNRELLLLAHMYLLKISLVDDREVFKVCLEYWTRLVSDLYNEYPFAALESTSNSLFLGSVIHTNSRRAMYGEVLSTLRLVMIERMVKPEEVLIVEDENGEIVRESVKETDTITLYKSMREVLVYLTHLDVEDTENIMTEKLARQFDGSEWSWNNLNKLCWAIGSISGAMNEEVEKRFLVNIIRDLLGLTEMKRGKDNKAVVASNIMYIVGQYPRFLKAHWKFLKTVINKLFEFMHEMHEGVQDMACDTFIKISRKCRRHFVVAQPGESQAFIDEILSRLPSIICDLHPSQVHTFYEAVGHMLQAQTDSNLQAAQLAQLMSLPNTSWDTVIAAAAQNVDVLRNTDTLKSLSNILRSNVYTCEAVGPAFAPQMSRIYMDMLSLYRTVSGIISDAVAQQGVIATKTPVVRAMRAVKKDILRLVETFISRSEDLPLIANNFMPPLLDAILGDYSRNVEQARDAEVLSVTAVAVSKLGSHMEDKVLPILSAVFECTLTMINKDFSEYPEHRVSFFKLLHAINGHCFGALLRLPPVQFRLIIDSILWAIKHTHRDIADTGLSMFLELLQNMSQAESSIAAAFYRDYYVALLQDIFYILTDTDHKAGFKYQSAILAHMFQIVSAGVVTAPIFDTSKYPGMDNRAFLQSHMLNLLSSAFPHLQKAQIETFVRGLFDLNQDLTTFKAHLRDFLISLKEFAGDSQELYLEELELEQERKRKADMEAAMKIPGLVKPMDRPDDLSD